MEDSTHETEVLQLGTSKKHLDPVAIAQGVLKDCPLRPGFAVMILPAASYNPRYRKALQNSRNRRGAIQVDEKLSAEAAEAQAQEQFASRYDDPEFVLEAFVADMRGIRNGDGELLPYTPERGLKILANPVNADVKEWITNEAHQFGHFYVEGVEADAGN